MDFIWASLERLRAWTLIFCTENCMKTSIVITRRFVNTSCQNYSKVRSLGKCLKTCEGCAANFKWLLQAGFLMKRRSVKPQHYISIMLSPQGGQLGGPSTLLKVQKPIFARTCGKTVALREFRVRLQFSWELALRP